jgi:hypothetical protein
LLLFVDCCLPRCCHCRRSCRRYSLSPPPPFSLLFPQLPPLLAIAAAAVFTDLC